MSSLRLVLAAIALAFLTAAPVSAQDAVQPYKRSSFPIFFDFFGTWRGEGTVGGWPSQIEMKWNPVFDSRFVRVSWTNDMTTKAGNAARFEGEGTYRPTPDDAEIHAGSWLDSQGMMYTLRGQVAGDSLSTTWGSEGAMNGRTTYRLLDRNTMRVHDEVRRDGKWLTLGLSTLVRQATAAAAPTD